MGDSPGVVRFGVFELDRRAGELRKAGVRLSLQPQPFRVLSMLVERPGDLVTREELRRQLWPDDTFVDFQHGLNAAVGRLRETLGDSAESPRFIETVPRRGYRFVGAVLESEGAVGIRPGQRPAMWVYAGLAVLLLVGTAAGVRWHERPRATNEPEVASLCGRALDLIEQDRDSSAELLLRDAIQLSPSAPLPYIVKAWTMRNRGKPARDVLRIARQAVDRLSGETDPRVRYFTTASYSHLQNDFVRAAADYEALLQLDPNHYWALNNLVYVFWHLDERDRAVPLFARLAQLRPNNIGHQGDAARALFLAGDPDAAMPFAQRACELLRQSGPATSAAKPDAASWAPWSCGLGLYVAWTRNQPDKVKQAAAALADLEGFSLEERDLILMNALGAVLGIGDTDRAERWAGQIASIELRIQTRAAVAYVRGDSSTARALLGDYVWSTPAILQSVPIVADVGLSDVLKRQSELQPNLAPADRDYVLAERAWARGERQDALELLDRFVLRKQGRLDLAAPLAHNSAVRVFRALLLQATDAEHRGDVVRAITLLEEVANHRQYACGEPLGAPFWLKANAALVRLYARTDRHRQAAAADDVLANLLRDSDSEFAQWVREPPNTTPTGPDAQLRRSRPYSGGTAFPSDVGVKSRIARGGSS